MNKNIYIVILIVIIMSALAVDVYFVFYSAKNVAVEEVAQNVGAVGATSPKDATYIIEGQSVTLIDGVSSTPVAPGSATKIITRYFGNEVKHDLNDDGREDVVFLLTQETGGSGTFYYVVAALNTPTGYIGSQAFFLGDRIAPQTTVMDEGLTTNGTKRQNVIVVNYADRKPTDSFTTPPSIGKSVWLKLDPATMQFGTVEQNFSDSK